MLKKTKKTTEEITVETAEEKEVEAPEKNANKEKITLALRAGIDLYKPIRTQFDNQFQGIEFVGDLKVGERLYIASEIGSEKRTIESENLNFTTSGGYIKLGIDYNMYNNWVGLNNDIFIGLRFGRSIHTQTPKQLFGLYQSPLLGYPCNRKWFCKWRSRNIEHRMARNCFWY